MVKLSSGLSVLLYTYCASEDLPLDHSENKSDKNKLSMVGSSMKATIEEKLFSVPCQSQINIYNIFIILPIFIDNIYIIDRYIILSIDTHFNFTVSPG